MLRELQGNRPNSNLRIWTPPDGPALGMYGFSVCAEWAGRVGHPSSYGLIGGSLISGPTRIAVAADGDAFPGALAAREDDAHFGLPREYHKGILAAVPFGLEVTVAAHGRVSSSEYIFGALATFLIRALQKNLRDSDEQIWGLLSDTEGRFGPLARSE